MICLSCGNEVEGNFCKTCGIKVYDTSSTLEKTDEHNEMGRGDELFMDYFSFRVMVSRFLIKVMYVVGVVVITAAGLLGLVWKNEIVEEVFPNAMAYKNLLCVLVIIAGNLVWRIVCEYSIILFSIHQELLILNRKAKVRV